MTIELTFECFTNQSCVAMQRTATHCNTMQRTATHSNTLHRTATQCNALQRTATHCNTMQHTATHCNTLQRTATHCNTLQHTAIHCNTLQHTASYEMTFFSFFGISTRQSIWVSRHASWNESRRRWNCESSFVCVTWLIRVCDMTYSCVRHDSLVCVTWLIGVCDKNHSWNEARRRWNCGS